MSDAPVGVGDVAVSVKCERLLSSFPPSSFLRHFDLSSTPSFVIIFENWSRVKFLLLLNSLPSCCFFLAPSFIVGPSRFGCADELPDLSFRYVAREVRVRRQKRDGDGGAALFAAGIVAVNRQRVA